MAPLLTAEEDRDSASILLEASANKVIIKAVRDHRSGPGKAKDLADGAPKTVKEALSKADA